MNWLITLTGVNDQQKWIDVSDKSHDMNLNNLKEILRLIITRDSKLYQIENQIISSLEELNLRQLESLDVVKIWNEKEVKYSNNN
jgi:hypothetical protein